MKPERKSFIDLFSDHIHYFRVICVEYWNPGTIRFAFNSFFSDLFYNLFLFTCRRDI